MNYTKKQLGQYIDVLSGFAFKSKDFTNVGIPVIKIKNINPPYVSLEDISCVPISVAYQNPKYILKRGDVLIAMTGSHINQIASVVGRVGRVRYDNLTVLNQRVGKIINKNDEYSNLDYIYYFLSQYDVKVELAQKAGGAANQANISPSDIKNLYFPCPPIEIQNKIATILSRYDSLIENYQKQIKLLEESAQRLYKEWFINLRFPGHENTKIVDGVPEGWEKKKLGDVSKTTSGGTPSRTNNSFYSGSIMWAKTKELCDGFIFNTEEKITEEAIKKSSAKIVPAGSILMAMYGATIGKLGIATKDLTCNQACCVFLISEDNPLRWYIFNWLLQNRNFLISQGKGAAQPNLSQDMIKGFELIIPDDKSLRGYHLLINPIYLNIKSLQSQICQLTEARNRLLPKLMNGEIEV